MFTNIEGDIDRHHLTDVVIRLDIRPGFEGQIHAKQELVNEILSK